MLNKLERGALWNELISGKYGEQEGGWSTFGMRVWKAIQSFWPNV